MIKILFTNIGRRNYFIDFVNDLNKKGYKIKAFISDTSKTTSSFYVSKKVKKIITPKVSDGKLKYINVLLNVCKKNKINILIPLIDTELEILSQNQKKFEKIGTKVLVSENHLIKKMIDKKKSYYFFKQSSIKMPKTFFNLKKFDNKFPIIKKQVKGSASDNMEIIENKNQLKNFNPTKQMLQKFIVGDEYGVDILNDFSGKFVHCCIKKKISMRAGETDKAKIVNSKKIFYLSKVASNFLKHIGPADVDLILTSSGKVYFLDVNLRFGGGYPFTHLSGCNYLKLIIDMYLGKKLNLKFRNSNKTFMKGISIYSF